MTIPIPIILCGKVQEITDPQQLNLLPEVDGTRESQLRGTTTRESAFTLGISANTESVVHVCHSVESARAEIPALLRGEAIDAASGLGSNAANARSPDQRRRPVAVIVGGGYTDEEFEMVRDEDVQGVPWLQADNSRIPPGEWPPSPLYPVGAAARIKERLREHGMLGGKTVDSKAALVWRW